MKKKQPLYIAFGIGIILLLSSFRNKNKNKSINEPLIVSQNGMPAGQNFIYAKPGAIIYNRNLQIIWTNEGLRDYVQMAVTGETAGTYSVVYGMNFMNGLPATIFKSDTTINPV